MIENYVRSEAQQVVDSNFGQIRRLTDIERVDIQKIVAQRIQHYREVKRVRYSFGNLRRMALWPSG